MKTVRFAQMVAACGRPEVHLLLVEPKLDPTLQRALKAGRVMTIHQANVGTKADFGTIGFERTGGQILIFPKSLARFAGQRVVGINFDLTTDPPARELTVDLAALPVAAKKRARGKWGGTKKASAPPSRPAAAEIVSFPEAGETAAKAPTATPRHGSSSRQKREAKVRSSPRSDDGGEAENSVGSKPRGESDVNAPTTLPEMKKAIRRALALWKNEKPDEARQLLKTLSRT